MIEKRYYFRIMYYLRIM